MKNFYKTFSASEFIFLEKNHTITSNLKQKFYNKNMIFLFNVFFKTKLFCLSTTKIYFIYI